MKEPKLYIGVMSKNVVDAALEYTRETGEPLGLIPSRRQVDFGGGYANKWTTKELSEYNKGSLVIERDHGGPGQGTYGDDGMESFLKDAECLDIIHVDPWKMYTSLEEGTKKTAEYIERIHEKNSSVFFEVGTEESIRHLSAMEFDYCLHALRSELSKGAFDKIKYGVIQSGVGLDLINCRNTGKYSNTRLEDMVEICKIYGIKSKEHNGDYLTREQIKKRFSSGLDAINIAPEFGQIETQCYIEEMSDNIEELYQMCLSSGRWKKWVTDFSDIKSKESLIGVCGHYIFSSQEFLSIKPDIDEKIKTRIKERIDNIICAIKEQ